MTIAPKGVFGWRQNEDRRLDMICHVLLLAYCQLISLFNRDTSWIGFTDC